MDQKLFNFIVWLLGTSSFVSSSKLEITGMENQVVKLGDSTTLTCTTKVAHDNCLFISPPPAKTKHEIDPEVKSGRIIYHGEDNLRDCGIKITKVTEKDNGKWTCVVIAKEGEDTIEGVKSANVTVLGLPGQPVFLNQTMEILADVMELSQTNLVQTGDDVTIAITFISNPKIDKAVWNLAGGKTIVEPNLSESQTIRDDGHYTATLIAGSESWLYVAKLTIQNLQKADLNSQNKLVIKNSLGVTELEFTLVEKTGGSGGTVVAIVVVLVILCLCGVALVFILIKTGKICSGDLILRV